MASQLFKTKSPELLIRESEHPDRLMKRSLRAFDITCLGIGAIIVAAIGIIIGALVVLVSIYVQHLDATRGRATISHHASQENDSHGKRAR